MEKLLAFMGVDTYLATFLLNLYRISHSFTDILQSGFF